jgi:hypothetical protein
MSEGTDQKTTRAEQHPHLGSLSGAGYEDRNAAIFWRWLLGIGAALALVAYGVYRILGGS